MIMQGLTKDQVVERDTAAKAEEMRQLRDRALEESDKTQLEDTPPKINKAAWREYRQKLRDITKAKDWPYIELPEAPK